MAREKKTSAREARGEEPRAVPPTLEVVYVDPTSLNPAPYNPRKMTEGEARDLRESLRRFGFVDPVIANRFPGRENVVIGGHQRLRIAIEDGIERVPAVFVALPEPKERELNLRLNKNVGSWDWDLLANLDVGLLLDVGFEKDDLAFHFDLGDRETETGDAYTSAVGVPQYEPTGERPLPRDLYDRRKADELAEEIRRAELPDDLREFLLAAAQRHVVFDYRRIAESYAHADAATQRLFERSALVIVDLDDAIRDGYVRFSETIKALQERDAPRS